MANEKTNVIEDKEITFTLKESELFQLTLSVNTRVSFVQMKWASATTQQEQNACENQLEYLSNLQRKLAEILAESK